MTEYGAVPPPAKKSSSDAQSPMKFFSNLFQSTTIPAPSHSQIQSQIQSQSQNQSQSLSTATPTTLEFINSLFPDEASLVAVEPLIDKLRQRVRRIDAEVLQAVRQQSTSGTKAKEDLASATEAITELTQKIKAFRSKAEESEVLVQDLCRDIKKLDSAKKHITTTITALHRLAMLVKAVEQLQEMAAKRQYREAAGQLEAVSQLCSHFDAYKDIAKINQLREKYKLSKAALKSSVSAEFSYLGTAGLKDDPELMKQLKDACLVVDALDPATREEIIRNICTKELIAYQQIFQGTEVARLDKAERRYAWLKRKLKDNQEVWQIFPPPWRVTYLLCMQFCKLTRANIMEILDAGTEKPDVATVLQAMQRTIEFEQDLVEGFGGPRAKNDDDSDQGSDEDVVDAQSASAIRKKYELELAEKRRLSQDAKRKGSAGLALAVAMQFDFSGVISSCFEPHLGSYVQLEEKTLMETLEKLIQEETWEAEPGGQTNILSSSSQIFLHIKKGFKRCTALTKSQTLLGLFKVFQRVLRAYAARLTMRFPRAETGLVASATGTDRILRVSDRDERTMCFIVNTAEYCQETAGQLAESVSKAIDPQLANKIDISEEQGEFSAVTTKALSTLVIGIETRLDVELANMTRVNWAMIDAVGDQSEYVTAISRILSNSVPTIAGLLSPVFFQFFIDKLSAAFAPRFQYSIYKCRRISETGAQQLLLDTQAVKTLLLEIPSLGSQTTTPAAYSKYVTREIAKAEALLKVILSPVEAIADTYRALLPDGTPADFQRILDLKGLRRQEQQSLLDYYSRRGAGGTATAAPTASTSQGVLPIPLGGATKDAMIAKAAAAAAAGKAVAAAASATGLKRIFQLAESAKEGASKEGTFRKLFNS